MKPFVISYIYDVIMELVELVQETRENWTPRDRSKKEETLSEWEKEHFE